MLLHADSDIASSRRGDTCHHALGQDSASHWSFSLQVSGARGATQSLAGSKIHLYVTALSKHESCACCVHQLLGLAGSVTPLWEPLQQAGLSVKQDEWLMLKAQRSDTSLAWGHSVDVAKPMLVSSSGPDSSDLQPSHRRELSLSNRGSV